jgi:hypothetical protein
MFCKITSTNGESRDVQGIYTKNAGEYEFEYFCVIAAR